MNYLFNNLKIKDIIKTSIINIRIVKVLDKDSLLIPF